MGGLALISTRHDKALDTLSHAGYLLCQATRYFKVVSTTSVVPSLHASLFAFVQNPNWGGTSIVQI